jgi:hypothetical protein
MDRVRTRRAPEGHLGPDGDQKPWAARRAGRPAARASTMMPGWPLKSGRAAAVQGFRDSQRPEGRECRSSTRPPRPGGYHSLSARAASSSRRVASPAVSLCSGPFPLGRPPRGFSRRPRERTYRLLSCPGMLRRPWHDLPRVSSPTAARSSARRRRAAESHASPHPAQNPMRCGAKPPPAMAFATGGREAPSLPGVGAESRRGRGPRLTARVHACQREVRTHHGAPRISAKRLRSLIGSTLHELAQ